jgi:predicted ester cyclase
MPTTDANKAVLLDILEAINDGRLAALDGHPGFWETRQVLPPARRAFADWRPAIPICQIAEGDLVFSYAASEMTHAGPFAGLAPTGRRVPIELLSLDQVVDGTVVEHNSTTTWADVLRRLGAPGFERWPARDARPLAPPAPSPAPADEGKASAARLLAALAAGDAAAAERHAGAAALAEELIAIRDAFPDLDLTLVRQLAEGDLVATRATLRGTHRGPLWGIAPTGRALTWDHFSLVRIADGLVVEARASADWNAGLAQLGRFPAA